MLSRAFALLVLQKKHQQQNRGSLHETCLDGDAHMICKAVVFRDFRE